MNGADMIAAERRRQVDVEGWTSEHDREHGNGELALAAICYATPVHTHKIPLLWPWDPAWWKPDSTNRVRDLVKAGALIAAEIDRLIVERGR